MGNQAPAAATPAAAAKKPVLGKSGKKICCSCPGTREPRDKCIVLYGKEQCKELIEKHDACLRAEGFNV